MLRAESGFFWNARAPERQTLDPGGTCGPSFSGTQKRTFTMRSKPADAAKRPPLLKIRDLHVDFGSVEVLHGVDVDVAPSEIHALIGESGSGKSVLARSILGLAGHKSRLTGTIEFDGRIISGLTEHEYEKLRGADIGLIVQDAMAALNPMRTIGQQLIETILYRHPKFRDAHGKTAIAASHRDELHEMALSYLKQVGITAPEKRMTSYAHQLSGGMRQRIMIALALVGEPKLLLADEPTTALDVVVQRELLQEMREIVLSRGMSMLLVTHDLHLAHDVADRVSVMYAGYILEDGPVAKVLPNPSHPYTEGLLDAMPDMESTRGTLKPIKGEIPPPEKLGRGCPFASRCVLANDRCRGFLPKMIEVAPGWISRCTEAHVKAAELDELALEEAQKERVAAGVAAQAGNPLGHKQDTDFPVVADARIIRHCYYARKGFFGRRKPWNVLEDVDLQLRSGEVMGLVGESGCGKSTLDARPRASDGRLRAVQGRGVPRAALGCLARAAPGRADDLPGSLLLLRPAPERRRAGRGTPHGAPRPLEGRCDCEGFCGASRFGSAGASREEAPRRHVGRAASARRHCPRDCAAARASRLRRACGLARRLDSGAGA